MSGADQEEDVEEEEEFHEVEEEKHKTSQESVGENGAVKVASPCRQGQHRAGVELDLEGDKPPQDHNKETSATAAVDQDRENHHDEVEKVESLTDSNSIEKIENELTAGDQEQETKVEPSAPPADDEQLAATNEDLTVCGQNELPETKDAEAPASQEQPNLETELKTTDENEPCDKKVDEEKSHESWANINLQETEKLSEEATRVEGELSTVPNQSDANDKPHDPESDVQRLAEDLEKKLDLDEDVKNPQYIPKKGVFYEHDDRSQDVGEQNPPITKGGDACESKDSANNRRNVVQERQAEGRKGARRQRTDADRWNHDLFRDEKQKPKSKTELINTYGYDIRQEKSARENRGSRGPTSNSDRSQASMENQRHRSNKDTRLPRQGQQGNRSRERKPRRQNNRGPRNDSGPLLTNKREGPSNRQAKPEVKDARDSGDDKQVAQPSSFNSTNRREHDFKDNKNTRNDGKGHRRSSRDRPNLGATDDKMLAGNTVMSSITVWSNEDMAKAEAFSTEPINKHQNQPLQAQHSGIVNNVQRARPTEFWNQNLFNKNGPQDRTPKNHEDNRNQQHYGSRPRYQDRDTSNKQLQFNNRNQYADRSGQVDWNRMNSPYNKSNAEYTVKTQTFENSRLSQANSHRSSNRDLREVLNERRLQGHQNYQPKTQQQNSEQMQHRIQPQSQHSHQYFQPQHLQQPHHQHLIQHPQPPPHHQQQQHRQQIPQQHPMQTHVQQGNTNQRTSLPASQPSIPGPQQQPSPQIQLHQSPSRPNNESHIDQSRMSASSGNSNDMVNSRPIIKTDAYTGANVLTHQQSAPAIPAHSQSHRAMGGSMGQQGPNHTGSHMVPSHMGTGATQAPYYQPSNASRDPAAAAAAMASAYHGYIPSGHSVMDTTRYHMTPQHLSDHGYMGPPGQGSDVGPASVMHQAGMYSDAASAGGTVASSAYLSQGSTLSSASSIPVTGAGPPPPMPPVSYIQHTQYPPPPYSNPYSHPQHNQPNPQSSHYPYWTYI